jgi:ubiquitin-conjugating enzyme E2 J2
MAERAALTRLRREYANIQAEKIPHIVARPTEKNMLVWHYVLHDLTPESPYMGGLYWGKLVFPKEYPLKPPAIYMLTPSGRFETNARLCLSMSDFHPESWNPSWRIESILIGLVSFMLDIAEPRTTGGVSSSPSKRREYAKASFEFNRSQAEYRELFPEFCNESKRAAGLFFLEAPPACVLEAQARLDGQPAVQVSTAPTPGVEDEVAEGARGLGAGAVGHRDRNNRGGIPAYMLALAIVVVVVSCIGLFVIRGSGSRGNETR